MSDDTLETPSWETLLHRRDGQHGKRHSFKDRIAVNRYSTWMWQDDAVPAGR